MPFDIREYISEQEFVEKVKNRVLDNKYSFRVHASSLIFSIIILFSLFFLILPPYDINHFNFENRLANQFSMFIYIVVSNIGLLMILMWFIKIAFKASVERGVHFRISYSSMPLEFIKYSYLIISTLSFYISFFELEFAKDAYKTVLSPLEAFYFISSVIFTTSSNIYPSSKYSIVLTILFSIFTVMMVIFVFNQVRNLTIKKKINFSGEGNINYIYARLINDLERFEFTDDEKKKLLKYFSEDLDYTSDEGSRYIEMYIFTPYASANYYSILEHIDKNDHV